MFQQVIQIAIPAITFFLMMVVGMDLAKDHFRKISTTPKPLVVGSLTQYLLPLCAVVVLKIFRPEPDIAGGMMILASSPAGGISNYYTYLARANVALSVVLTTLSCLVAAITMPLLLLGFEFFFSQRVDFHVPFRLLLAQLLLLLCLPVVLGIMVRNYRPTFVHSYEKTLRRAGLILLAALIVFVLYQTQDLLIRSLPSIFLNATSFVVISMLLGFFVSRLFGLSGKDCFTLMMECGVRNVGIATTAAVVILKRTQFANFAATYFLIEAVLILITIFAYRKWFS